MRSITAACHFWKWFRQNEEHYLRFFEKRTKKEGDYYFDELQAHARACNQWLGVDIMVPPYEKGVLIITACCQPRGVKKARLLASKAPLMENWTVHALRQPNAVGEFIRMRGNTLDLDPCSLWFQSAGRGSRGRRGIHVFVEELIPGQDKALFAFVWDVLENFIGEEALGLDIALVDIDARANIDHAKKLYAIEELPAYAKKYRRPRLPEKELRTGKPGNPGLTVGPDGEIEGF